MGKYGPEITPYLDTFHAVKWTHHDIQNDTLRILAPNVLRVKVSTICEQKFFSIMADEGTDVSNIEQL